MKNNALYCKTANAFKVDSSHLFSNLNSIYKWEMQELTKFPGKRERPVYIRSSSSCSDISSFCLALLIVLLNLVLLFDRGLHLHFFYSLHFSVRIVKLHSFIIILGSRNPPSSLDLER